MSAVIVLMAIEFAAGAFGVVLWIHSDAYPLNPARREREWMIGVLLTVAGMGLLGWTVAGVLI